MKNFFLFLACLLPFVVSAQVPAGQSSAARHFEVTILQSTEKGSLANGNRFDWAPGVQIPAGNQVIKGISIPWANTKMEPTGRIFIRGLSQIVDNAEWAGMLEPDGMFRYTAVNGAALTVPAFRLSSEPDPVAAWAENQKQLKLKSKGFSSTKKNP